MALLLKKEILHERVYSGKWKGQNCVLRSRFNLDFLKKVLIFKKKVAFRIEEAGFWDE